MTRFGMSASMRSVKLEGDTEKGVDLLDSREDQQLEADGGLLRAVPAVDESAPSLRSPARYRCPSPPACS